jgi:DNA replication protein DnaC
MEKINQCKLFCKELKLHHVANEFETILQTSQNQKHTLVEYAFEMLQSEVEQRNQKSLLAKQKLAALPLIHDFTNYDNQFCNGISNKEFKQLCELFWLEQNFNIILMGPSGVGKTYIAVGLCNLAVNSGYRAYFRTIEQITKTLKLKDTIRNQAAEHKRLLKANLIVIDDLMLFPFDKTMVLDFFNFVNTIYENTAFIITTNKSPQKWTEMIDDTVFITALLDRLLFKCQVIKLEGQSFRMKNRKQIFENSN